MEVEGSTEWLKKFRDFLETYPSEGARFFIGGLFKGSLIFCC